uniref:Galectin n=1 Tax=Meloidogyne hapla TaxID=6305 RepID=A0A1I8AY58_MELHA
MGQTVQMPYTIGVKLIETDIILFRFRCMINNNTDWFNITFQKDFNEYNSYEIKNGQKAYNRKVPIYHMVGME